jgi:hypothetical protein
MSDPNVPDRPQAGEGQSETVGAPFRDAEAPTRGKTPFVWMALVVLVALAVGALVAALGFGLLG